ncbi:MAG: HdeD family acid-resistance protein [Dehalococcoidia bacterium]
MIETLTRNWGWIALRGAVAVAFGILTVFYPGITLASLVILFGAFAFTDGTFTVISAVANRKGQPRWVALLLSGLVGIAAGVVTFFWPGITGIALLAIIASWAIVTGIIEMVVAVRLRKEIEGEWLLGIAGLLAIVFGVFMVLDPGAGALAVALYIGAYAFISGVMMIALGFRLRSWGREHPVSQPA